MHLTKLTDHAHRVHAFMLRAKQTTPTMPTLPDEKTRLLRAKLIMEEALETIEALGVTVVTDQTVDEMKLVYDIAADVSQSKTEDEQTTKLLAWVRKLAPMKAIDRKKLQFAPTHAPDLIGIVDGCADVSVVTIGTLLACGVEDKPILELVDTNNLAKFGPGHSYREDGKLIKPPGHRPPDITKALILQGLPPVPQPA